MIVFTASFKPVAGPTLESSLPLSQPRRESPRGAWSSLSGCVPVALTASGGRPLDALIKDALPADAGRGETLPVAVSFPPLLSRGDTVLSLWGTEWSAGKLVWSDVSRQRHTVEWAGEGTVSRNVPPSRVRAAVRVPTEFVHLGRR